MSLPSVVAKHLTPGERVLAVARCESVLGPVAAYLAVTSQRLLYLRKTGLFAWDFSEVPPSGILGAQISESMLRATVTLLINIGVAGPREYKFPDIPKDDAAELVAAIHHLTTQGYPESLAYQTKRCPDCDELVKARAIVCKHCGHKF